MTVTHIGIQPEQQETRQCGLDMHQVLAAIPGMTYRQLDYWTRTRRLKVHHHNQRTNDAIVPAGLAGSGTDRCWPLDQVALARRVYKLSIRGIDVNKAFALATDRGVLAELLSELTKIEAELRTTPA